MLEEAGIDGSLRAENLEVEQYIELGRVLQSRSS